MKILLFLFALSFLAQQAWAQSTPTVNLASGTINWSWTTNGDPLSGFLISCTNTGPEGLDPVVKDVTSPAARSFLLSLIPVIAGTWSCTVSAYNDTEISAVSTPVVFIAQTCAFH